ncbi:hypothetical protein BJX68DRAFT_94916 [Aspergillus pseudodeflectus]|uniref:Zn(2)-C6 fungal-type domain-containing protein n=1 Tax=Aspergillus pseudodeflectus TaxID=176178 RepID=A0ABR4KC35_9EURO
MDPPHRSNQPRKTRSACDKCHTQKLRCTRKPGQSRCERCLRLNAECRFAPRAKRGSKKPRLPSHSTSTQGKQSSSNQISTPSTGQGLDIGDRLEESLPTEPWLDTLGLADPVDCINWDIEPAGSAWDINLDTAWAVADPDRGVTQNVCTLQMALDPMPSAGTTSTHELANLSIALYELTAKLPSVRDETRTASDIAAQSTRQALPFMFDELFSLTTQFTNVSKHYLCGIEGTDEPTALMVGSCHSRLTKIYIDIFSMMQRCVQHTGGPPRPRPDGTLVLPNVQMGSLSCPSLHVDFENPLSVGTGYMYMWMVAVFSAQLLGQLADTMRERPIATGKSLVYGLWKEMGERMDGLLETIESTKSLLR